MNRIWVTCLCALVLLATSAAAQSPTAPTAAPPSLDDAPAAPIAPEVITRDASGDRATIRAVKLQQSLTVDGRLDEAVYSSVKSVSGFMQMEPREGDPATEKTEFWIFYDERNVYVAAKLWESEPGRMVVNEMRRDNSGIYQNENFSFLIDTFYDRRNGVALIVNPLGGVWDAQVTDERDWNGDFNVVADVKTGRFEGGWSLEVAIPFKSLRYRPSQTQTWGFLTRRTNRWKNETTSLTRIPAQRGAAMAIMQTSLAATLVGVEAPPQALNLELKPYALSSVTTDRRASPAGGNDLDGNAGFDVKYGVTQNLALDFTVNTDFAQVEADEQQVNLTRFNLFFPEKREFFLENRGLFTFGGVGGTVAAGDVPVMFYSRQIGLAQGRLVPLRAGARATGRVGAFSLGVMNLQAGDDAAAGIPSTNFSVVRLRRDLLRRSSVGLIFTGRSATTTGSGFQGTYGADGTFGFLNNNLTFATFLAKTNTDGRSGEDLSYRARADYGVDRYGAAAERLVVGANFNPAIGFLRRSDIYKNYAQVRFSPRPRSMPAIRKFSYTADTTNIENAAGQLMSRNVNAAFGVEFQNSDNFSVNVNHDDEVLQAPFRIAPAVTLPQGAYGFWDAQTTYKFGQQRPVSGNLSIGRGTFYTGHKTTFSASGARIAIGPTFAVEPNYSINAVDLREGSFTTHLLGSRVTYMRTPRMFVSALLQYNSSSNTMSSNVRLRWEYQPGSELFVVYNDERDTLTRGMPDLLNRTFVVKINKLFRF